MTKFKVGDKVRCINTLNVTLIHGSIYTITTVHGDTVTLGHSGYEYSDQRFELVKPEVVPNPCIVPPSTPQVTLQAGHLSAGNYVSFREKVSIHIGNPQWLNKQQLVELIRQLTEISEVMEDR